MDNEVQFKVWLETQELEESWKKWLGGAALAAAAAGGLGQAAVNSFNPAQPSIAASQWDDSITPKSSARSMAGSLTRLGPINAMKIRMSGGGSEHKLAAAKDYARSQFGVSDKDIHVVKASDYLKKIWGSQWKTVLDKAKQHKTNMPGMPNLNKLDDPVVLVKVSLLSQHGMNGTCRYWGTGVESVQICTVDPTRWGNSDTAREELTHSTQDRTQGQIAGIDKYAAHTEEFGAKLAELKRVYYKNTGEISNDGEDLFNWAIKNFKKLPKSTHPLIFFYAGADEEKEAKIIQAASRMLPGLVQQGDTSTKNIA